MKCPACGGGLGKRRIDHLVMGECRECGGMWFSAHDVGAYVELLRQQDPDHLQKRKEIPKSAAGQGIGKPARMCPACDVPLERLNYAYDSGVLIDRCPACQGIWTDAGEPEQIVTRTTPNKATDTVAAFMLEHEKEMRKWDEVNETAAAIGPRTPFAFLFLPRIIIPLQDDAPSATIPFVTIALIATNLLVFAFQTAVFADVEELLVFWKTHGLVAADFPSAQAAGALLTHMFLHAGVFHVLLNVLFLWLFGDNVEDRLGHLWFLPFYLGCGLVAGTTQVLADPGSAIPCIGASGAVAGVMGAYLILYPSARIKTFVVCTIVTIPAALYLVVWALGQVAFAALSDAGTARVAWYAHVGGFFTGLALAFVVRRRSRQT